MNEAAQQAPAVDGATAGSLLRQAREAAGVHVATLAVSLKVPVRKLEALEEDRYDLLPDAVFVRALASSVCRTLKIDSQPVLERLPQSGKPRLVQDGEGINTPFRAPGDASRPGWMTPLTRPAMLAVAALLLGALLIALVPGTRRDEPAPAETFGGADSVVLPGTPATVVLPSREPVLPASVAVAPAPAPVLAASAAAALAGAASAPTVQGVPPASGIVTFRAKGPSWIQVTDANGTAVLRRQLEAGEMAGASGAAPLSVTVGSVRETEVLVRGKPFDMGPVSRDNVARFEVK